MISRSGIIRSDAVNCDLENTGTWLFVSSRVAEGKISEIHSLAAPLRLQFRVSLSGGNPTD